MSVGHCRVRSFSSTQPLTREMNGATRGTISLALEDEEEAEGATSGGNGGAESEDGEEEDGRGGGCDVAGPVEEVGRAILDGLVYEAVEDVQQKKNTTSSQVDSRQLLYRPAMADG